MTLNSIGWRRILGVALAGVSMFAVTSAFAEELTVWCWDPNFNGGAMRDAAAAYQADHPDFTIDIVDFAKADLQQKLQSQLASGVTQGLPDIILIEDYGAQKYLQAFPGAFEPLGDEIDLSGFADYKVALATYDGHAYSVPFDSGATGIFYRKDYFAEAGYTADDLKDITWHQLIEIGKNIEAKTGHKLFSADIGSAEMLRVMMQSAGTWYFTPDGEVNIANNEIFKKALTTWVDVLRSDTYEQTVGWADWTGSFISGDVASALSAVWLVATLKANPEQAGQWAVAPMPKLEGVEGADHYSNDGGSSWYVLSSAEHKELAIDFLKEVWAGNADFYQTILRNEGAVGTYMAARDGEAYTAVDDFFQTPVWQDFSDWMGKTPSVNYGLFTDEADSVVSAHLPALRDGASVEDAIPAMDAQLRQQTM